MGIKSKELAQVKSQIKDFKDIFIDNPEKAIKDGTWFETILQMVLNNHAQNVNAEYFKAKYKGIDNERIAYKLVNTTSNYVAVAGGVAATAASAAQLSAVLSGGITLAAFAATLIGEISFITYKQLQLIYDISVVLDARFDRDDPEDIMTLFMYSLGVNIWEDVTNLVLKVGPRSAEYLGRKALRTGIRAGIQTVVAKFGGVKLAQKITEKALLKFIVPGVNIPVADTFNKVFTKKLGAKAIKSLKHRSACIIAVDKLGNIDRTYQLISIPLVYHIGIIDEPKDKASKCIEMQNNICKRIIIRTEEESLIDDMIALDFEEFIEILKDIDSYDAKEQLASISCYAWLSSKAREDQKFDKVFEMLSITNKSLVIRKCERRLN